MISTRTKAEARTKKERARKVLILNLDCQRRKHPVKKDMAILGNQAIGIPALLTIPLVQLLHGWHISPFEPCPPSDARCSGSWLHTVNWTESCNQMVSEVCVVSWHYDRILPLHSVFCVLQLRD